MNARAFWQQEAAAIRDTSHLFDNKDKVLGVIDSNEVVDGPGPNGLKMN
jgi:hypothetical protein